MRSLFLALLATAAAGPALAEKNAFAIGAGIGTTGPNIEAQLRLPLNFAVRGGYNFLELSVDDTYDDVAYDGDLELSTVSAFLDWHPGGGGFMISAGAFFGPKELDLNAQFADGETVDLGDETFSGAEVGTLNLTADLEDVAPFLGIGYNRGTTSRSGWGLSFLAGAMLTGTPDITLTTTSELTDVLDAVAQEEENLRDDIEDFEIYPVLNVGLTFGF